MAREYIIIYSYVNYLTEFTSQVNKALDEGYILVGGLVVTPDTEKSSPRLLQAMIRHREPASQ